MHFLGKVIKYLLRSLFSIAVFILIIGLAKTHWDVSAYIDFLNTNDWSSLQESSADTWTDLFRPNQQASGDIADILTDDTQFSGLDVYDPTFEDDLNQLPNGSGTEEEDFGFITGTVLPSDTSSDSSTSSKTQLLNLIKQRELTK